MPVAEQEREDVTENKVDAVTFISKCPNLVVVVEPRFDRFNHMGIKIGQERGHRIEFERHRYMTEDAREIELLRAKPQFNVPSNQGFYEEGNAPDEPKPTVSEQQEAIHAAAGEGDVDAIREVIETEENTHNRDVVFATARAVLATLARETPSTEAS